MIKQSIKRILNRMGYQVVSNSLPLVPIENYRYLVECYGNLLRSSALPALPEMTDRRKALLSSLIGVTVPQAMMLIDSLNRVLELDGDVCEFGVAQGATSALLANELLDSEKKLWMYDSFEGLPKPTAGKDELKDDIFNLGDIGQYEGKMKFSVDLVKSKVAGTGFPSKRTEIVPGFIEEVIASGRFPERVAFAFVDFDFYEPIKVALEYLDKALVDGGMVVVHDYDYFSTGSKTAVDEFLSERTNQYSFSLPDFAFGICVLRKCGASQDSAC